MLILYPFKNIHYFHLSAMLASILNAFMRARSVEATLVFLDEKTFVKSVQWITWCS